MTRLNQGLSWNEVVSYSVNLPRPYLLLHWSTCTSIDLCVAALPYTWTCTDLRAFALTYMCLRWYACSYLDLRVLALTFMHLHWPLRTWDDLRVLALPYVQLQRPTRICVDHCVLAMTYAYLLWLKCARVYMRSLAYPTCTCIYVRALGLTYVYLKLQRTTRTCFGLCVPSMT